MNNPLTTFTTPSLAASTRVIEIDGKPWFVAKGVLKALGLMRAGGPNWPFPV
jgi:prophage antirepressor-like protein